jgi:ADP-ribose pyrophosphatase YjhB (NUDIX family)
MSARKNLVVCVGAVVRRSEHILLVRQGSGHPLEGQWTFPWGFVDAGESPADAGLRETAEEAGVHARIEGVLGVQDLPDTGWLGIAFLCEHRSGEAKPDGREVDRAGFYRLSDLDRLEGGIEPWSEWVVRRVFAGRHSLIPNGVGPSLFAKSRILLKRAPEIRP